MHAVSEIRPLSERCLSLSFQHILVKLSKPRNRLLVTERGYSLISAADVQRNPSADFPYSLSVHNTSTVGCRQSDSEYVGQEGTSSLLLGSTRSIEPNSYGNVAGWVAGCHSRYCIKTTKPILNLFGPSGSPII